MTTSDEAFLDEVENFLGSCTLPAILAPHDSGSDSKEVLPTSTSTTPSERVADIVSLRPSLTFKVKIKVDAATKRELEKAKDRKRRSAYRERRRIERESLQKELEQLTETLQRAQDGEPNLYASVWRKLAERQYAARLSAETERRQLCRSIDVHGTLLHQFRAMIDERFAGDVSAVPYEHKRVRLEPSGDPIFAAYLDELAGVYAQTEEILRSGDLDSTEANWEEPSEAWIKDPDTGYFLYRGKLTLPFNYRDICRSRWFTAPLHHRNECRQVYEDVDDPENTIALKFRITTRLSADRIASVVQRLVLRRYEESERTVIVWRLFTEGEGVFAGMHADETGWGVVTPVRSSSRTGTVMTTCVRNVPMHLSSAATCAPVLKQFAGKLVEWGSENNLEVTQRLKNLQLNEG
ncbi:hypothetical protein PRIC1_010223 [Phytophthora ramorum]|uniref:uncharacterized protein n=1 Tax=Phytophthora ramorum TaxID=164328 RepID=UPI0030B5AD68|nr:hypothetical protein KRP23_11065 [Phytophthora ramorum]KAH7498561.1 hypothetical protein KRP22_11703 [Phytophthora ramorum]